MQIIHQSQSMIWMPLIYHLGNILIALWCNSSACEIRLTVEHQFCQKFQRDHHRSPLSGEYFVILLDSLTIRPWRDHDSDRNASGTLLWLIGSCHSVFLGTSISCFIYISSCYAQVSLCRMYCGRARIDHSGLFGRSFLVILVHSGNDNDNDNQFKQCSSRACSFGRSVRKFWTCSNILCTQLE